jgi:hypothetical protein
LAKSLTAPRGAGYFSAANAATLDSAKNSAIQRVNIIIPLLGKDLIILFFTNYRLIFPIFIFRTELEYNNLFRKSKLPIIALLNTDDHACFMHYFKYFQLKWDNISYSAE